MHKLIEKRIQKWCKENDWTDYFVQNGRFYGFPPEAVMPLPIPTKGIKGAKPYHFLLAMWQIFLMSSG